MSQTTTNQKEKIIIIIIINSNPTALAFKRARGEKGLRVTLKVHRYQSWKLTSFSAAPPASETLFALP